MNTARHMTSRRSARHRGFTLPEVLATMLLMGIILPAVLSAMSMATRAASHARYTATAATLAETRLNELIADGTWTDAHQGDFGSDWPGYRWECGAIARDTNLNEVMVVVYWAERGEERSLNVATLVYSAEEGMTP